MSKNLNKDALRQQNNYYISTAAKTKGNIHTRVVFNDKFICIEI